MKICHLTSVHPRYDTRVFLKMSSSLAAHGHSVSLIVADGRGNEERNGIKITDVGISRGRVDRVLNTTQRVLRAGLFENADVYHLHDPELIFIGLWLKIRGKVVVFDSHEDVPKQLLSKPYLSKNRAVILSRLMSLLERAACPRFDGIVVATPSIGNKFERFCRNVQVVNNYPLLSDLEDDRGWQEKRREVCYVGAISTIRGVTELVRAAAFLSDDVSLNLGGVFSEPDVELEVKKLPGWSRVNELGFLSRAAMKDVLGRSMAGLVTFLPAPNHLDAQPNKMFEYMSAGIPVIASRFPLWTEIIEGNQCGICVDPENPEEIALAIKRVVDNPEWAKELGENGRRAVVERYNWEAEEKVLLAFYENLF